MVLIVIVLFVWGPQKLPEMAKAFGEAKKQFEKAAKEGVTSTLSPEPVRQFPQDPIIVAAKSLGISTEGKTKLDLSQEILKRSATT